MVRRALLPALVFVAATTLVAAGCGLGGPGSGKGDVAPDFSLPVLGGGADNLRNYRGHVVILNFWGSDCLPCRAEMPDLQATYTELRGRGLTVVGVNRGEPLASAAALAQEFDLTFPILLDEDLAVSAKYDVRSTPTTLIIDRQGVIRERILGGPLTRTEVRRLVEGLLK